MDIYKRCNLILKRACQISHLEMVRYLYVNDADVSVIDHVVNQADKPDRHPIPTSVMDILVAAKKLKFGIIS